MAGMARSAVRPAAYRMELRMGFSPWGENNDPCANSVPCASRVAALDDGGHLVGQLGDEMLAVPRHLGFGKDGFLRLARKMRPGGDDAGAQAAHQAFIFGRIFERLVFAERHATCPLLWG